MENQIINQIIGSGISGAILVLVIMPIITWLKTLIESKDKQISELINRHLESALQARKDLTVAINNLGTAIEYLPRKTVEEMKKEHLIKK